MISAVRRLRLERSQEMLSISLKRVIMQNPSAPPLLCVRGVVPRLSTDRSLVSQPGEKFWKLLSWRNGPHPLTRHFLSAHYWPGMLLLDESQFLSTFWNLGRKHPLKSIIVKKYFDCLHWAHHSLRNRLGLFDKKDWQMSQEEHQTQIYRSQVVALPLSGICPWT